MLDEMYEYIDGVQEGSVESCREEIGDVMINVFMTQLIHSERHEFTPIEALNEVCEKLIRRHPHVFSDLSVKEAADATKVWNNVKSTVEGHKTNNSNIFEHIPGSLPPMEEAYEIQKNIKKVVIGADDIKLSLDKIKEELRELESASTNKDKDNQEEEVGDLLFAVVNLSRMLNIRPNIAMRRCNNKIKTRFQYVFNHAMDNNMNFDASNYEEIYKLWNEAKLLKKC